MQIKDAIDYSIKKLELSDNKKIDSEILLCFVLNCKRTKLYAYPQEKLSIFEKVKFKTLVKKRATGYPIAYITNEKEFWSKKLFVDQNTLVPRPETELLVEISNKLIKLYSLKKILELGTGSGAIAIAIASENITTHIDATDIHENVINVATRNAIDHKIENIVFIKPDWFKNINKKKYDLIVTNPPYIKADDPCLINTDIKFEPTIALSSGVDGYNDLRKIISHSQHYIKDGGWLIVEHGYNQGLSVRELFNTNGFTASTLKDYNQLDRLTYGKLR